ncbi:MAG: glycosyltransferase family 2 protein [Reichenbachiella sp.]|uniref:glycosyltransferase family 2 protein n=1 Tax=Reichenbachiella sp. TaxID=2184521 RepID=UPI002966EE92|nr:glycosyltransferase family 2 protein [Reichenbachiella sp.]MDW3208246.1 glycosyltransferase family 2 protein [Reichenbachiella sp.]
MKNNKDLITIISPLYNAEHFILETINSVLNQTYNNWEWILIDDASSDNSVDLLLPYSENDSRIKLFRLKENVGAGEARNIGLSHSHGNYITFLDADDYWDKDKLQTQLHFHLENNCCFSYSWYYNVDSRSNLLSRSRTPNNVSFRLLKFNNYILTSSIMCNKETIDGLTFPKIRKRQDWVFFLKLLKRSHIAYAIEKELVYYRSNANSLSANKLSLVKPNYIMFRDYIYSGRCIPAILHFFIFLPLYVHNKLINKKKMK